MVRGRVRGMTWRAIRNQDSAAPGDICVEGSHRADIVKLSPAESKLLSLELQGRGIGQIT